MSEIESNEKLFVSEQELIDDSFRLAMKILQAGFIPTFLVGLWRGGSSVGIYVQECLQHLGVAVDHFSVRTSYRGAPGYLDMLENSGEIRVHGLKYLYENLNSDDRLLIVDDVFSSGSSVRAVIDRLKEKTRRNMPQDIRVAAPWYRLPDSSRKSSPPDFYMHQTKKWLVLPYELSGLTPAEICEMKPGLAGKLKQIEKYL